MGTTPETAEAKVAYVVKADGTMYKIGGGGGGGGSGTTILSGEVQPVLEVGSNGDYYIDTEAQFLYGPKDDTAVTPPPPATLLTDEIPQVTDGEQGPMVMGEMITFLADGYITALRYYRSSSTSSAITETELKLWNNEGDLITTALTSGESAEGWYTVTLGSSIWVQKNHTYVVSGFFQAEQFSAFSNTISLPITNGNMRTSGLVYDPSGDDVFPTWYDPTVLAFVDVVFEAQFEVWPLALGEYLRLDGGWVDGNVNIAKDLTLFGNLAIEHDETDVSGTTYEISAGTKILDPDFLHLASATIVDSDHTNTEVVFLIGASPGGDAQAILEVRGYTEADLNAHAESINMDPGRILLKRESVTDGNALEQAVHLTDDGVELSAQDPSDGSGLTIRPNVVSLLAGTIGGNSLTVSLEEIQLQAPSITMQNTPISDVGEPVNDTDAATKGYVDANAGGGGGAGGHVIQEEGTPLTARAGLNFVGSGVTATDDAVGDRTIVTVVAGLTQAVADTLYVSLAGGTMTGPLLLDADPVNNLEAAPKQYVDARTPTITSSSTPPASPSIGDLWINTS